MIFKVLWKDSFGYVCPIFSEFEKNYLLSEIDMILSNSGSTIVFDNFKKGRIFAYSFHQPEYFRSELSGILKDCLLELFEKYPYLKKEFEQNSLLKYACTGGSENNTTGQVKIEYNLSIIKEIIMNGFENYIYKTPIVDEDFMMEDFFKNYNKNENLKI